MKKFAESPQELAQRVSARVCKVWETLLTNYPGLQKSVPTVLYSNRLKTTAGQAYCEAYPQYIELSTEMLWYNLPEFERVIIPHELAHLAAFSAFADCGHGDGWRTVMHSLGLPADRCHTLTNPLHTARKRARIQAR
jgi:predicted SprT family Zn-dependent metalloprotease